MITSVHNPRVKRLRRLYERRYRDLTGLTLVEGWRSLDGLVRAKARIDSLWLTAGVEPPEGLQGVWREMPSVPRYHVSPAVMRALSETAAPQGVLSVVAVADTPLDVLVGRPGPSRPGPLIVVLDGLQDPGNAGALVRTALAVGADGVVATRGTVDLFAPRALRAAAGLTPAARVSRDVAPETLVEVFVRHNIALLVLDPRAEKTLYDVDWKSAVGLVIGSEAAGPSDALRRGATGAIRIPMAEPVESLNAAVSGAVCLYEAFRGRQVPEASRCPSLSLPEPL